MGGSCFFLGACTQGKIDGSHRKRTVGPTHTAGVFLLFLSKIRSTVFVVFSTNAQGCKGFSCFFPETRRRTSDQFFCPNNIVHIGHG